MIAAALGLVCTARLMSAQELTSAPAAKGGQNQSEAEERPQQIRRLAWLPMASQTRDLRPLGDRINDLAVSQSGSLWVATGRGLSQLVNGRFRHFGRVRGLPDQEVSKVIRAGAGIAAATLRGFVWVSELDSEVEELVDGNISSVHFETGAERLWYAGLSLSSPPEPLLGHLTFSQGRPIARKQDQADAALPVTSLVPFPNGNRLLAMDTDSRWRWIPPSGDPLPELLPPDASLPVGSVTHLLAAGRLQRLLPDNSLQPVAMPSDQMVWLMAPRWNAEGLPAESIWVAYGQVLATVGPQGLAVDTYALPPLGAPRCFAEDLLGRLWLGTENGLYMADPKRIDWALDEDSEGVGKGLPGDSAPAANAIGASPPQVKDAGFTPDGKVWTLQGNKLSLPGGRQIQSERAVLETIVGDLPTVLTEEGVFQFRVEAWRKVEEAIQRPLESSEISEMERMEFEDRLLEYLQEEKPSVMRRLLERYSRTQLDDLEFEDSLLDEVLSLPSVRALLVVRDDYVVTLRPWHNRLAIAHPSLESPVLLSTETSPIFRKAFQAANEDVWIVQTDQGLILRQQLEEGFSQPVKIPTSSRIQIQQQQQTAEASVGRVFAWSEDKVWQLPVDAEPDEEFEAKIDLSRGKRSNLSGFLPDSDGKGALLGYWEGGLDHVPTPLSPQFNVIDSVRAGGGHNAFLRTSSQGEFIFARSARRDRNSLWARQDSVSTFEIVEKGDGTIFNHHINDIIEYPKNRVWFAASDDGVWVKDSDGPIKQVFASQENFLALALTNSDIAEKGKLILWTITVEGSLFAVNQESMTLEEPIQTGLEIKSGIGDGANIWILHSRGLARFSGSSQQDFEMDDWTENPSDLSDGFLARPNSGDVFVSVTFSDPLHSLIWKKDRQANDFRLLRRVDSNVVLSLNATGEEVWLADDSGNVFVLEGDGLRRLWALETGLPQPPLVRVAAVSDTEWLLQDGGESTYRVTRGEDSPRYSNLGLQPWKASIDLDGGTSLVLHQDSFSLIPFAGRVRRSNVPFNGEGNLSLQAYALGPGDEPGGGRQLYIVAGQRIWRFDKESKSFVFAVSAKPALEEFEDNVLAVDQGGFWIGTRNGLWRLTRSSSHGVWRSVLGLPHPHVNFVIPRGENEAWVSTAAGHCIASSRTGWWSCEREDRTGIMGQSVRVAETFSWNNKRALAVGTEQGVSIALWAGQDISRSKPDWLHLNADNGLLGSQVYSLHWSTEKEMLWVGTEAGVDVVELTENGRLADLGARYRCSTVNGLPKGLPVAIQSDVDEAGPRSWLLVKDEQGGHRVVVWRPGSDLVQDPSPLLLAGLKEVKLSPPIEGEPPSILALDAQNEWLWIKLAGFMQPRLELNPILGSALGSTASVMLDSFAGSRQASDPVEWFVDRIGNPAPWGSFCWPLDFWSSTNRHFLIARLQSEDGTHVLSQELPQLESATLRALRLAGFGGVAAMSLGIGLWGWRRHRRRRLAVRYQQNPYVVGAAIEDPNQCFGREELLKTLKNTIAKNNWALYGEFRIGKTTIQVQLAQILNNITESEYAFLPIFVDLQHLLEVDEAERNLIYLVGDRIAQFARQRGVAAPLLESLAISKATTPAARRRYNAAALGRDLDALIESWREELRPRKPLVVLQIDEVQLLQDMEYSKLSGLRALLVKRHTVRAVLSGASLPKRKKSSISPWWNIFREEEILPLKSDDAERLILEPVRGLFRYDAAAIQRILSLSDHHRPQRIQEICSDVINYKYAKNLTGKLITEAQVLDSRQWRRTRAEEAQ